MSSYQTYEQHLKVLWPWLLSVISNLQSHASVTRAWSIQDITTYISQCLCNFLNNDDYNKWFPEHESVQIITGVSHAVMSIGHLIDVYAHHTRRVPDYDQISWCMTMMMKHSFVHHYLTHVLLTSSASDSTHYIDRYYEESHASQYSYFHNLYKEQYFISYCYEHFTVDVAGILRFSNQELYTALNIQSGQCPALTTTYHEWPCSHKKSFLKDFVVALLNCYQSSGLLMSWKH